MDTENPKFCSRSCSASFNSIGVRRHGQAPANCLVCGIRTTSYVHKYCSRECHIQHKKIIRNKSIESGEIVGAKNMKNYLLEKHGNICLNSDCLWDFTKISITVELEHTDGNYRNTSLDNCTLLCPNCHSLTPTYKNKNKGNGREYRRKQNGSP